MKENTVYLLFFVIFLSITRIIPHPPNFTPLIASAIIAPYLINNRYFALLVPILAMFIADIFIGLSFFQIIIYFSILFVGLFSSLKLSFKWISICSLAGSIWFFASTNFAVWLLTDYYPKNLDGLIYCYTMAIPFFKNTLLSTILFVSLFYVSIKYLKKANLKTREFLTS